MRGGERDPVKGFAPPRLPDPLLPEDGGAEGKTLSVMGLKRSVAVTAEKFRGARVAKRNLTAWPGKIRLGEERRIPLR